jgi:hypothetical protein
VQGSPHQPPGCYVSAASNLPPERPAPASSSSPFASFSTAAPTPPPAVSRPQKSTNPQVAVPHNGSYVSAASNLPPERPAPTSQPTPTATTNALGRSQDTHWSGSDEEYEAIHDDDDVTTDSHRSDKSPATHAGRHRPTAGAPAAPAASQEPSLPPPADVAVMAGLLASQLEDALGDAARTRHTAALMLLAEARVRERDWRALQGSPEQAAYRHLALDSLLRIEAELPAALEARDDARIGDAASTPSSASAHAPAASTSEALSLHLSEDRVVVAAASAPSPSACEAAVVPTEPWELRAGDGVYVVYDVAVEAAAASVCAALTSVCPSLAGRLTLSPGACGKAASREPSLPSPSVPLSRRTHPLSVHTPSVAMESQPLHPYGVDGRGCALLSATRALRAERRRRHIDGAGGRAGGRAPAPPRRRRRLRRGLADAAADGIRAVAPLRRPCCGVARGRRHAVRRAVGA